MSNDLDTSVDFSGDGFDRSARNDRDEKAAVFSLLDVYHDISSRPGATNMAIDEALLEVAERPTIRFYRWDSPALSFGYFGRFAEVATYFPERDLVRRWTGGGIVFHGEDLTYAIIIPASDRAFLEPAMSIYESVHRALKAALVAANQFAELAAAPPTNVQPAFARLWRGRRSTVHAQCFSTPVRADVMLDGRKIAGAAQRRTRRGLLQQGSIQHVDLRNGLAERFARAVSVKCETREISGELLARAEEIAARKYATEEWLRKR